ncbi:hypothetical protein ACFXG4_30470 [Nocardia sp. NPDC059246]|uniref:hypothetical protein n=1 Tax=unclassified Nocardia TaxID=2637762 RepID=UPI003681957B
MISLLALAAIVLFAVGVMVPALLRVGGGFVALSSLLGLVFHGGILDTLLALTGFLVGSAGYLLGHLLFARQHGFFLAHLPFKIFGLPPLRRMSPAHY